MTWDVDLVLMTRLLIDDLNSPQKYTDQYIKQILVTAGILVKNEVELSIDYVFDISNITISPDPIINKDSISQALLSLKSACILTQGEFRKALGQGIKVRDGDSQIDTSVSFKGYTDILKIGPCASYNKLKKQINAGSGNIVSAVLTPFRSPTEAGTNRLRWFFDQFTLLGDGSRSVR